MEQFLTMWVSSAPEMQADRSRNQVPPITWGQKGPDHMAQVCVFQPASETAENLFSQKQNHTLEFLATHWWGGVVGVGQAVQVLRWLLPERNILWQERAGSTHLLSLKKREPSERDQQQTWNVQPLGAKSIKRCVVPTWRLPTSKH